MTDVISPLAPLLGVLVGGLVTSATQRRADDRRVLREAEKAESERQRLVAAERRVERGVARLLEADLRHNAMVVRDVGARKFVRPDDFALRLGTWETNRSLLARDTSQLIWEALEDAFRECDRAMQPSAPPPDQQLIDVGIIAARRLWASGDEPPGMSSETRRAELAAAAIRLDRRAARFGTPEMPAA